MRESTFLNDELGTGSHQVRGSSGLELDACMDQKPHHLGQLQIWQSIQPNWAMLNSSRSQQEVATDIFTSQTVVLREIFFLEKMLITVNEGAQNFSE